METSIHDHHILQLAVDAAARTIRLRTAYPERNGPRFADIVFEDVEGYVFYGDALGTILFDIDSVDALTLYRAYAGDMQRAYTNNGGHRPWSQTDASAEAFLSRGEINGYRVTSSIGLEGAIWARRCSIHLVTPDGI